MWRSSICQITIFHNDLLQNDNDRTIMKGHRRVVAIVEDFFEILEQVHNKGCLHAG